MWAWAAVALGAAWNIFGIVQWVDFTTQTEASLMMKGMTPSAAALYYGLPAWMKVVFAVGSFGGLIGSLLLFVRRREAIPIFAVSLAGYSALFVGDQMYGVFEAIPGQLAVLILVVAVAAVMLGIGLFTRRRGLFD
jgi:hypothetical protein